jgi:hypothetical protein
MYPQKHWFNEVDWEMAKHVDNEVKKITKIIVQNVKFVFLASHEITSMNSASWATYWWLNYARLVSNTFDVECATKKIGFVTSSLILLITIILQWGFK